MKKLFGLFALLLCTILLSCNNLFSDKTGDISFSFSADDAIQAANAYMARGANNDEQSEYIFLVQIQGSEGFHDYQIKTVQATNVDSSYAVSGQYLTDNKLEFLFDYVPFDQTYKVMFDMFAKIDSNLPHLVLSGNSNDIEVMPSIQTEVVVNIGNFTISPISLKVEYTNGDIDTIDRPNSISSNVTNNQSPLSLFKEYGKLWGGPEEQPIKRVYYELDPNSNFPESSFKYSLPCTYQSTIKAYHNFSFQDGTSSPKDFLFSYSFPDDYLRTNGVRPALESSAKANISKGNFTFEENLPKFEYRSNDVIMRGHRSNVTLRFDKKDYSDGRAFVYADELQNLLVHDVKSGESVALVLKLKNSNPLSSSEQLYYKMDQTTAYLDSPPENFGQLLFLDNHCINHAKGEPRFVIPLNNYGINYKYLMLFVKNDSNLESVNLSFDIDYYIFPSSMRAFILDVAKQDDGSYRYQIDENALQLLVNEANFQNNQDYKATVEGILCNFDLNSTNFSIPKTELTAEIYYLDSNNNYKFTAISNKDAAGTILTQYTTDQFDYASAYSTYDFVFNNIRSNGDQDYKFLCHVPFQNSNTLLVLRDYNLTITKVD